MLLSISEQILLFICGLGVLQGFLLAGLIYFHPRGDRSVTTFLALHIFFMSVVVAFPFLMQVVPWKKSYFVMPLPLLVGPFLYLYLRSFKERITFGKAWIHFLPVALFYIPVYLNISFLARKYPDLKTISTEQFNSLSTLILMYVRLALLFLYYIFSRNALRSYQRSIQHLFSETTKISLRWARVLINGYLFLVIISILIFQLMFRYPEHLYMLLLIDMAVATPYIYLATFKGIQQPSLWQSRPELKKEELEHEMQEAEEIEFHHTKTPTADAAEPDVPDAKTEETVKKINRLMVVDKLYQEPELTVQQLASLLQLPTYLVSQAINEGMKRNFYDLVNSYRVEEAKRLLLDPANRNYTILSVGFEAGFNSKTTFNTVFKKFTGLTPTEFRDRQVTKEVLNVKF